MENEMKEKEVSTGTDTAISKVDKCTEVARQIQKLLDDNNMQLHIENSIKVISKQ